MSNNRLSTLAEDEHQIANLLFRWGHARDSDDWETLAGCFHDDATVHISWISGPINDFITRSRNMAAARKPGAHVKHLISGPWILINHDRAFSRCHVNLCIRGAIDNYEIDLQSWLRFFDLLERRNGAWRIVKRTGVYEKDRMDPVDPLSFPRDFFAQKDLSVFPASAKFLCYWYSRNGHAISTKLISVYSDEERTLREEGLEWIKKA